MIGSGDEQSVGAVVLAGGQAMRMGGLDKASIEIGGVTLLERALAATGPADEVVVVGNPVRTSRPVTWAREMPPGGGPAAGLLAGLDQLRSRPQLVCVLAVDMPMVTARTFGRLLQAVQSGPVDGAVLEDQEGRRQPLAAVYRRAALRASRPDERGEEHGLAMKYLLSGLRLVDVSAQGREALDVDTWEDLRALTESP